MRYYTDACRIEKIRGAKHKIFLSSDFEPPMPNTGERPVVIPESVWTPPSYTYDSPKRRWVEDNTCGGGHWDDGNTCSARNPGHKLYLDGDGYDPWDTYPLPDGVGPLGHPKDGDIHPDGKHRWEEENTCSQGHWVPNVHNTFAGVTPKHRLSLCGDYDSEEPYMRLTPEMRSQAISLMRRFKELSIENVLTIGHEINSGQSSRIREGQVFLGHQGIIDKCVVFPDEDVVGSRLAELCKYVNDNPDKLDRVELAAAFAYGFCMVHPFADGNGRTSRLLANYFLKPGEAFKQLPTERTDYRKACLQINMRGDLDAMYRFFHARL